MKKNVIIAVLTILVLSTVAFIRIRPFLRPTVEFTYIASQPSDMVQEAEIIVQGEVLEISDTRWNQDSGRYWAEGLPYYELLVTVHTPLVGPLAQGETLTITVLGHSPTEALSEPTLDEQGQLSLVRGQPIVLFAEQRELAWRNPERKLVFMPMGGPEQGIFRQDEDGTYRSIDGEKRTLAQLTDEIGEVRDTAE